MAGVIHVKDGSTWKSVNFGAAAVYVKDAGTWKEPTAVYVKDAGTWKKVYPSDLETWTSSNRPVSAERQSTHNPANLSTDPAYVYTNILLANTEVRWAGRTTGTGQWIKSYDFGWSPALDAGFDYGAVTRIEVTHESYWIHTPTGSDYYRMEVGPNLGTLDSTGDLTYVNTLYTHDYTVAGWGVSSSTAGALHTSPTSTHSIEVTANYQNLASYSLSEVAIQDLKCRLKYLYNT